jgi:transposase
MEACCGAHHLARQLASFGHAVRLMSPEYVRPYVKAQKNDDRDAEAIAEASTRPTMRFVETKSEDQLDLQTLHRSRSRLVSERTALINQLRAILLERGIVIAQGRRKLEQRLAEMLVDGEVLTISARMQICGRSGVSWTVALQSSTPSSSATPGRTRRLGAWRAFLGLA